MRNGPETGEQITTMGTGTEKMVSESRLSHSHSSLLTLLSSFPKTFSKNEPNHESCGVCACKPDDHHRESADTATNCSGCCLPVVAVDIISQSSDPGASCLQQGGLLCLQCSTVSILLPHGKVAVPDIETTIQEENLMLVISTCIILHNLYENRGWGFYFCWAYWPP